VYEVGVVMAGVEVRSASGYTPIVDKGIKQGSARYCLLEKTNMRYGENKMNEIQLT
jgi:hypothetical protein